MWLTTWGDWQRLVLLARIPHAVPQYNYVEYDRWSSKPLARIDIKIRPIPIYSYSVAHNELISKMHTACDMLKLFSINQTKQKNARRSNTNTQIHRYFKISSSYRVPHRHWSYMISSSSDMNFRAPKSINTKAVNVIRIWLNKEIDQP
jgi:hypothetical protein